MFSFHFWQINNTSFLPFSWLNHSNFSKGKLHLTLPLIPFLCHLTPPFWSGLQQYQHAVQDAELYRFISKDSSLHFAFSISPVNACFSHCLFHRDKWAYSRHLLENKRKIHSKAVSKTPDEGGFVVSQFEIFCSKLTYFSEELEHCISNSSNQNHSWHKWSALPSKSHGDRGGKEKVFLLYGRNTLGGTDDRSLYARTSLWQSLHKDEKRAYFANKKWI